MVMVMLILMVMVGDDDDDDDDDDVSDSSYCAPSPVNFANPSSALRKLGRN